MRAGRWLFVSGALLWGVGCGDGDSQEPGASPPAAGAAGAGAAGAAGKGEGASSGSGGQGGSGQAGKGGSAGQSAGAGGGTSGAGQGGISGSSGQGGKGGSAGQGGAEGGTGGKGGEGGEGASAGAGGKATCSPGQTDCPCLVGSQCLSVADYCKEGICREIDCAPGSEGCSCLAGGCDPGLFCKDGASCVDATGYEGGPCLPSGKCNSGNLCDASQKVCVHCELGSAGCQCKGAGACNPGLVCSAGECFDATSLPPTQKLCYTPCRQDLLSAGKFCDADGLIEGCLDGQECVEGSCVEPGGSKPTCGSDIDCPFFQACLQGGCYSNCAVSADCPQGQGCHKKACRQPCQVATPGSCPQGMSCASSDGEGGFCVPLGEAAAVPGEKPTGKFTVSVNSATLAKSLTLSNTKQSGSFVIRPEGPFAQEFTVRKLRHTIRRADGSVETVRAPIDTATGGFAACDAAKGQCPLPWLELVAGKNAPVKTPTVKIVGEPDCAASNTCPQITVDKAGETDAVGWEGELQISSKEGTTTLFLEYSQRPEGQWVGSVHYFGTFNDIGLDEWLKRADKSDVSGVNNGLIQRWGAFRKGSLDGWEEFTAVLTATREESYKLANIKERCSKLSGDPTARCYPYKNAAGARVYVQNSVATPIPAGPVELPLAINLRPLSGEATKYEGKIDTPTALQYAASPAVSLELAADPSISASCAQGIPGDCVVFLKSLESEINVGGRYKVAPGVACQAGFSLAKVPWLIPGFLANPETPELDNAYRYECRDSELPFGGQQAPGNAILSAANPVPDGQPRKRTLRLLDGALVNQSEMFFLFREEFESFIPGQKPVGAYGYVSLRRAPSTLTDDDFKGTPAPTSTPKKPVVPGATCDPKLLGDLGATKAEDKIAALIQGSSPAAGFAAVPAASVNNEIHYLCEDTGLFDGGSNNTGLPGELRVKCPPGSKVTYFHVGANKSQSAIAAEKCQTQGNLVFFADGSLDVEKSTPATCGKRLAEWVAGNVVVTEQNPLWRCTDPGQIYCDSDRENLRKGKDFFQRLPGNSKRVFLPLRPLIDAAFRYKTRFQSSSGTQLGFSPTQCIPGSEANPYCYDPAEIEEARQRVDCLVQLYTENDPPAGGQPDPLGTQRNALQNFLQDSFSEVAPGKSGFERLNAELMIVLGDEAYTQALASRFDLAGVSSASFLGSELEPGGIDLTGVAGAEMRRLYLATQYYQTALDRLYLLGPNMQKALARGNVGSDLNFITPETVTLYLERLIRAATQKARAWGEVAKRYQNFNRPDLARSVIERSYTATYLESALMSRLMLDILKNSAPSYTDQMRLVIENAQRTFRMGLLDMREIYRQITDDKNFFGLPPDYIPFPALNSSDTGAYDNLSAVAKSKMTLAKQREETALASDRTARVDVAQFQSELVNIKNTYENQLASLCGTFSGNDGKVYPATRKYAHLSEATTAMGDPCGRMGNGDIYAAIASTQDIALQFKSVALRHSNLLAEVAIEQDRVRKQCGIIEDSAVANYTYQQKAIDVRDRLAQSQAKIQLSQRIIETLGNATQVLDCEIQCFSSGIMAGVLTAAGITAAGVSYAMELESAEKQKELSAYENDNTKLVALKQCDSAVVDSEAKIQTQMLGVLEIELEALRTDLRAQQSYSDVNRLFMQAKRLQDQQSEAEQRLLDVQAAQNDPNVRIYQNDAVINADVSFSDAMKSAYRATRVFEYYTSQSYAKKEQLFLIRMISSGQYNLENYLTELDNAFADFEEQFGNPDTRVAILSLRDDILKIPYLDEKKVAYSEAQRINLMRQKLADPALIDRNGYLTIPFSTSFEGLSPLTRNHKIRFIEADIVGSKVGDTIGRLYLRMAGTGQVRNVGDGKDFFAFPERTAVLNPFFNGNKIYDLSVYRSDRFRDRPFVNSLWELTVNQRDEIANQDIDLQSLSDIRLLVYYSDFTSL